jgi:hypothetical protein
MDIEKTEERPYPWPSLNDKVFVKARPFMGRGLPTAQTNASSG